MKNDALKQFNALREALIAEKTELEEKLAEIDRALGTSSDYSRPHPTSKGTGARRGNPGGLRHMVLEATKSKPLTRQEIVDAVQKAGYKFTAKDPLNSLGVVLYTSGAFKNYGGKFGPA